MSYIVRTGNLAETPELRQGENGPYVYARVLVSDSYRQEDGSYVDGPTVAYDLAVSGSVAKNLVEAAQVSGNIRLTFSGMYSVSEYKTVDAVHVTHRVRVDEIGVSLRGQRVIVDRHNPN